MMLYTPPAGCVDCCHSEPQFVADGMAADVLGFEMSAFGRDTSVLAFAVDLWGIPIFWSSISRHSKKPGIAEGISD
jgi:hypothetical protein